MTPSSEKRIAQKCLDMQAQIKDLVEALQTARPYVLHAEITAKLLGMATGGRSPVTRDLEEIERAIRDAS